MNRAATALALCLTLACSEPAQRADKPKAEDCGAGTRDVDGTCLAAGVQLDGCPAGELGVDGACVPAGIPADACAPGFVAEAGGCSAVLPSMACADGLMAVPGETACHPVGDCGTGPWGDIPVEANTQYVDGAYLGGNSNGSATQPWLGVQSGVNAAVAGAIVAVAAGSYVGGVSIETGAPHVWGRCAAMVEIVGIGAAPVVLIASVADGVKLSGLAVRGGGFAGVVVSDAIGVELAELWVHDVPSFGVLVSDELGPAAATLRGSLVERAVGGGITVSGSQLDVSSSLVRDVSALLGQIGAGIVVQKGQRNNAPSFSTVTATVMERNQGAGLYVLASNVGVDASVLRDTTQDAGLTGSAIFVIDALGGAANLTLTRSVIERNLNTGIAAAGSTLSLDAMTIRDTGGEQDGLYGRALTVESSLFSNAASFVEMKQSLLERNAGGGAAFIGSIGNLEGVLVRGPGPTQTGDSLAFGVASQTDPGNEYARVSVRGSVLEGARVIGAFAHGGELDLEGVAIIATVPNTKWGGSGIHAEPSSMAGTPPLVSLDGCSLDGQYSYGVALLDGVLSLEGTLVQAASTEVTGLAGDGVVVALNKSTDASAMLRTSVIESNTRAGLTAFGAVVDIGTSVIRCNAFDINVEEHAGILATVVDAGGNECGCDSVEICKAVTAQLSPPSPLDM